MTLTTGDEKYTIGDPQEKQIIDLQQTGKIAHNSLEKTDFVSENVCRNQHRHEVLFYNACYLVISYHMAVTFWRFPS